MAGCAHRAGEEARVEQVQDRVLDAADILVDRQPILGCRALSIGGRGIGRSEAHEIPGRNPRTCPWCRSRGGPVWRTSGIDVLPGRMALERVAGDVEGGVLGQLHRQILLRNRDHAAGIAVDDRDRAAPVALARDAPVAQARVLRWRPAGRGTPTSAWRASWKASLSVSPSRKRELIDATST